MPTPEWAERTTLHARDLDAAGHDTTGGGGGGVTDHGALTGLADNDHPQYATDTDLTTHAATPHGGATAHSALTGLAADDHPQYATDTDLTTHAATPHGGSALTIKDEGVALATDATSLDFVGSGVVASGTGAAKTITINGATAFIGAHAYNSGTQTGAGVRTLNSEVFDTDGFHNTSTNNSRMTIPAGMGGYYVVRGFISGGSGSICRIIKNGSPVHGTNVTMTGGMETGATVLNLAAGDYVELYTDYASTTGHASAIEAQNALWIAKLDSGKVGAGIGALVYATSTYSNTAGNQAALAYDAEDFDTDGFHDNSTNNTRLTVPAGLGGKYLVTAHVHVSEMASGGNQWDFYVRKNGSTGLRGLAVDASLSTGVNPGGDHVLSGVVDLAAGDYIEAVFYSSLANVIGHATAQYANTFSIMRLDSGATSVGAVLDYAEITTPVSPTATTEATANTVVTGAAVTYNGSTTIRIEFYSPHARPDSTAARLMSLVLYDGSSSIGTIGVVQSVSAVNLYRPVMVARRLTPSAGAHTYSVRAFVDAGTGHVVAGAGGSGNNMPAFLRITAETPYAPPSTPLAGYEYDYVAITSPVTITGTAEASETTVVTGTSVVYDGATTVLIEFFSPALDFDPSAAGDAAIVVLYDGATLVGRIATFIQRSIDNERLPVYGMVRRLPSAGSHQFVVKAYKTAGTVTMGGGAGGSGTNVAGFIRITKV